jgi:hypothetical protein
MAEILVVERVSVGVDHGEASMRHQFVGVADALGLAVAHLGPVRRSLMSASSCAVAGDLL